MPAISGGTAASALHLLAACPRCGRQFDVTQLAGGRAAGGRRSLAPGDRFRCSCGGLIEVPSGRAEDAAVVACAACGAPRSAGAASCAYCGADFTLRELDLDAICPRCAARVSRTGRFCHHCALPLTAPRSPGTPSDYFCPACSPGGVDRRLVSRRLGSGDGTAELHLFECPRCAGVWLDRAVFTVLVEGARQRRSGLQPGDLGPAAPDTRLESGWTYRPCPLCGKLMHRRNYGRRSGVIVDLCGEHGARFDAGELRRVLDWVRVGGAAESVPDRPEDPSPITLIPAHRLDDVLPWWADGRLLAGLADLAATLADRLAGRRR